MVSGTHGRDVPGVMTGAALGRRSRRPQTRTASATIAAIPASAANATAHCPRPAASTAATGQPDGEIRSPRANPAGSTAPASPPNAAMTVQPCAVRQISTPHGTAMSAAARRVYISEPIPATTTLDSATTISTSSGTARTATTVAATPRLTAYATSEPAATSMTAGPMPTSAAPNSATALRRWVIGRWSRCSVRMPGSPPPIIGARTQPTTQDANASASRSPPAAPRPATSQMVKPAAASPAVRPEIIIDRLVPLNEWRRTRNFVRIRTPTTTAPPFR